MNTGNNVILITGGTSGIGLEIVQQFYALGNKIIVTSKNENNLEKLKFSFPKIETIVCDLGNMHSVSNLVERCLKDYNDINIIINNAGIQNNYSLIDKNEAYDEIEEEIRINFISPMQIINGMLPILVDKTNAAIINVSSCLALFPKKSAPIYCASKAALHIGTKSLRYQLENTAIKVFEIIPPLVDTPMTEGRGKGKVSSKQLVDEFLRNFKRDKFESNIGKTKVLRIIHRIFPKFADNMLKNR